MKTNSIQYVLKWSGRYLNQYRFHFLLLILLSLVSIALSLFQVNTVQGLIDAVLAGSRTRTGTAFISFSATGLAIMLRNGLFESLAGRLEARTGCAIRNRLLRHILKVRQHTGKIGREDLWQRKKGALRAVCFNGPIRTGKPVPGRRKS